MAKPQYVVPSPGAASQDEAETCRQYVIPKLAAAGWDDEPFSFLEQKTFTDGRIVPAGRKVTRKEVKRADYILRYRRDFEIAVVEAKAWYKLPGDGMQQAKDYAEILGLKFAYATNGKGIVGYDFLTGLEIERAEFPTPEELWARLAANGEVPAGRQDVLLAPTYANPKKPLRYYQRIAVNEVVKAILSGQNRVLLTMATGTGKTDVAFQVCWKLWSAGWNRTGEPRKPRILFLSDRTFLVDDPKDKTFAPFGDARHKIQRLAVKSREMYFSTYQAIAADETRPGLYKSYKPDFFDLVIVDECHRGSAADDSNWREILEHFKPAYQFGMTATPLREDNKDTYAYFGAPVYTYSLKEGIDDGFLAPYRVYRVLTRWDADGWRPEPGQRDRYNREIPDREYTTADFDRVVALRARTEAIARHLSGFMAKTDRHAKTIVFCVDQEHADTMRRALNNYNADLARQSPDYVVRITAIEGEIGMGHLSKFQDVDTTTPVIAVTSKLLTTGVDVPTCENIVLARVINSMTEFKQIIGRGTRVRDDYGKYFFNILDYTGSATRLFADPAFDGDPAIEIELTIDETGEEVAGSEEVIRPEETSEDGAPPLPPKEEKRGTRKVTREAPPNKLYVDGGYVEIVNDIVYELDAEGGRLRVVRLTDYTADKVRTLYANAAALRRDWADPLLRAEIIRKLEERGIDFDGLRVALGQPEADPFDLLCHVAYQTPLRTRRERADRVRRDQAAFLQQYQPEARAVLEELLDKYASHGAAQFLLPDALQVPPVTRHGNVGEIVKLFGGAEPLREAVKQLQELLYAA